MYLKLQPIEPVARGHMVYLRQTSASNNIKPVGEFTEGANIQTIFDYFKKPLEGKSIQQSQLSHFGWMIKPSQLKILRRSKGSLSVLTLSQASKSEFGDSQKAFIDRIKSLLWSFERTFSQILPTSQSRPFCSLVNKGFTIVEAYRFTESLQTIIQIPQENYVELVNSHKYYWNEFNLFHLSSRSNSLVCHLLQNINLNDLQNLSFPWMKMRNLTSVYLNCKKNFFPALTTWNHSNITTSTISRRNECLAIDMLLAQPNCHCYRLNDHVSSLEAVVNQHLQYIDKEFLENDVEL